MRMFFTIIFTLIFSVSVFANTNIPKFSDYPVEQSYIGKPANLRLNNETAKDFRTRLRESLLNDPVFAGEYVLASWGCGIQCVQTTFVNKRTGQVIDGFGGESGETIDSFRLNSRLLVTQGYEYNDEGEQIGYFAFFYILKNEKFILIKKIEIENIHK